VAVVVHGTDGFSLRPAAYFEHLAAVRWKSQEQVEVLASDALTMASEDPEQERHFAQALVAVKEGEAAYDNLEPDTAIDRLGQAVADFEKAPLILARQPKSYRKALIYLAASHILNGDLVGGQEGFRRVLVVDPGAQLNKRVFPPGMVSMFDAARRDLVSDATSILSVVSSPEHARVYVGGVFRGVTPCDVDGLPLGQHLVGLRKAGYAPWAKVMTLRTGIDNSVNCRLEPAPDGRRLLSAVAEAAEELDEDQALPPELVSIAVGAGLDRILVGRLSQGDGALGLRLGLFDLPSGKPQRIYDGMLPGEGAAFAKAVHVVVTFMLTGRDDVLQSHPNLVAMKTASSIDLHSDGFHEPEDATPLVKRWWFWTAIAAGVAAVATGVTLGVMFSEESQPGSQILLEF